MNNVCYKGLFRIWDMNGDEIGVIIPLWVLGSTCVVYV